MVKKYIIHTLGCKVNQYDSGIIENLLISNGFKAVTRGADIVLVNTCSVTKSAITKNQRAINKLKRESPRAKIIAFGCWPKAYELDEIKGVDMVVYGANIDDLIAKLNILGINIEHKVGDELFCKLDKSRYFLKIQDGCEQFCSYCVIPYSRGKMKSRKDADIIREAKKAVLGKHSEIVLSGVHIGLYGKESNTKVKKDLAGLIGELIKIKDLKKTRISSIEINEVNDDIIALFQSSKMAKHLHISLQSGCDKILELMNRPYNSRYFFERVEKIREQIPGISISTDIIVGFPGESEKDFKTTYDFARKMVFSKIHVFSFSPHEKTPAYSMKGHLDKKTIQERSQKLRALSLELEKDFVNSKKGELIEGIVQNIEGDKVKIRSEYYFEFFKEIKHFSRKPRIGSLIKIKY